MHYNIDTGKYHESDSKYLHECRRHECIAIRRVIFHFIRYTHNVIFLGSRPLNILPYSTVVFNSAWAGTNGSEIQICNEE